MDDLEAWMRAVPWKCQLCGRSSKDIDLGDLCGLNPLNGAHLTVPDYPALAALVRSLLTEKERQIDEQAAKHADCCVDREELAALREAGWQLAEALELFQRHVTDGQPCFCEVEPPPTLTKPRGGHWGVCVRASAAFAHLRVQAWLKEEKG